MPQTSWSTRIRTWTNRTKICCATFTPSTKDRVVSFLRSTHPGTPSRPDQPTDHSSRGPRRDGPDGHPAGSGKPRPGALDLPTLGARQRPKPPGSLPMPRLRPWGALRRGRLLEQPPIVEPQPTESNSLGIGHFRFGDGRGRRRAGCPGRFADSLIAAGQQTHQRELGPLERAGA